MRSSHVATALVAFSAGLTAAAGLRRLAGRRLPATALPAAVQGAVEGAVEVAIEGAVEDAVVLPFSRPVPAIEVLTAGVPSAGVRSAGVPAPARCGDTGGRTKVGAPCGARATRGGRCHHHPLAA